MGLISRIVTLKINISLVSKPWFVEKLDVDA